MRRVKRTGDTSRLNQTRLLGVLLLYPRGLGLNEIVRMLSMKADTALRNLRRLVADGFVVQDKNGAGKRSPYRVNPEMDDIEQKSIRAGLFRPEHGHLFAETAYLFDRRKRRQRVASRTTIAQALDHANKVANFLIGMKESKRRGMSPSPRAFSSKAIIASLIERMNPGFLAILEDWCIAILRKGPTDVETLRHKAALGGTPLRTTIALTVLEFMRNKGLVVQKDGMWRLTDHADRVRWAAD